MTFAFCNDWSFRKDGGVPVSVNGQVAGSHKYGYTAFDVVISDAVHAGSNIVTVHVDNSLEPNCRWYSGSGIYRPVQLLLRDKVHIETVHIETVSIDPAEIRVDLTTTAETPVTVEIDDGDVLVATGKPLASMYFMQIVWGLRKKPFIGVRPVNHAKEAPSTGAWQFTNAIDSWSWQGYEGAKAAVEVCARPMKCSICAATMPTVARSGSAPGKAIIMVKSPGVEPVAVEVEVK